MSDQCNGNKDNGVGASFSPCTEFYLYTGYHELFYIETRIILPHLWHEKEVNRLFVFLQLEEGSADELFCMWAFRLQVVRIQLTVENIPALA